MCLNFPVAKEVICFTFRNILFEKSFPGAGKPRLTQMNPSGMSRGPRERAHTLGHRHQAANLTGMLGMSGWDVQPGIIFLFPLNLSQQSLTSWTLNLSQELFSLPFNPKFLNIIKANFQMYFISKALSHM